MLGSYLREVLDGDQGLVIRVANTYTKAFEYIALQVTETIL